ncbi:LuxR family transcriptional regulator [Spongiactinospora rosea]|uniref:LuxR family transcriptional regulator n=1 Tax=Spongiactinospora rosea TaxID=2248750 RepID=A0A366LWS8_9ACTN|nr:cupin domain-containing protein [Spongiactinospora rosea]RBQ17819.1 LuxR family transcriptional regulator [Spongiactinospora rosea]
MESRSLTDLAAELLATARGSGAGRAARTVHTGQGLRQTLFALAAGRGLGEHDSPGEATLQVLAGRVRLRAGAESWEGGPGDLVAIPPLRHALDAIEDSAALLTVAERPVTAPAVA